MRLPCYSVPDGGGWGAINLRYVSGATAEYIVVVDYSHIMWAVSTIGPLGPFYEDNEGCLSSGISNCWC